MPRLQKTCSREVIYHLLQERPMTRKEVVQALEESHHPSYKEGTVGRVIGSLVNDGLVTVRRSGRSQCVYEAIDGDESLLQLPQTAKYVSWVKGERKTGYNSKKSPRSGRTAHIGRSSSIEYLPDDHLYIKDAMIDDGSDDSGVDWIGSEDNPIFIQADWLWRLRVGYKPLQ